MTKILRPDHFTIVTDQLSETKEFYAKFLGFAVGARPNFKFPGCWLYANGAAVLHVIDCLLYTSPSPRDLSTSRMPSSA